jgi:hypothetical protein
VLAAPRGLHSGRQPRYSKGDATPSATRGLRLFLLVQEPRAGAGAKAKRRRRGERSAPRRTWHGEAIAILRSNQP